MKKSRMPNRRASASLGRAWDPWFLWAGVFAALAIAYVAPDYPPKGARPTFDEVHYLHLLRYGWASVTDGTTGLYYASKSLPFLLVNALFGFSSSVWDFEGYYGGMIVFNTACLAFAAWVLVRALALQGLKKLAPAALILLLCNRAFLNFYIYYPRLPDAFVLGLGALFLLGHVENRRKLIWASLFLSLLSCPQLTVFIVLYLAFPLPAKLPKKDPGTPRGRQLFWSVILGAPALGLGLWTLFVSPETTVAVAEGWQNPKYFKGSAVVLGSITAAGAALWFSVMPLQSWHWTKVLRSLDLRRALLAVVAVGLVTLAMKSVATGESQGFAYGIRGIAIKMSYLLSKPGPGPLSHIVFFGLTGAFALMTWRELSRWVSGQGPGFALAFATTLIYFGLDGEVRHVIFLLPLVVLGICHAAREKLLAIRPSLLIWTALILSLNWVAFLNLDETYAGERHLSAFGMCWSPIHYGAAIAIGAVALLFTRMQLIRLPARNG